MKNYFLRAPIIAACALAALCSPDKGDVDETSALIQPPDWRDKLPRPVYASLERVASSQWWFEVYKLPGNVFAIYEPYQFEEALSYLVTGDKRAILIDTGTGIGDLKKLVDGLTDLPVTVVNTHTHYDHVGNDAQFTDIAVFNNADCVNRLIAGVSSENLQKNIRPALLRKGLPEDFDPETWEIPPVEPTYLLDDGTIIDLGGRTLEVIYTPGHAPGEICLLDRDNRILFTGDMFFPGPLYAFGGDVNLDEYTASVKKLTARLDEYDYLCPGHNEPWVKSDVIPRVGAAFDDILQGKGDYREDGGVRRYFFRGFDILIRADMVGK